MTKRPKRPRDPNQLGKLIVDLATGERMEEKPEPLDSGARVRSVWWPGWRRSARQGSDVRAAPGDCQEGG